MDTSFPKTHVSSSISGRWTMIRKLFFLHFFGLNRLNMADSDTTFTLQISPVQLVKMVAVNQRAVLVYFPHPLNVIRLNEIIPLVDNEPAFCWYGVICTAHLISSFSGLFREIWKDPSSFNPDRFLSADGTAVNKMEGEKVMLFGMGKRRCIGEVIARNEVYLFLAILAQKLQFQAKPGQPLDMTPEYGLTMKHKRCHLRATMRVRNKQWSYSECTMYDSLKWYKLTLTMQESVKEASFLECKAPDA